jgi:hypothetical protein
VIRATLWHDEPVTSTSEETRRADLALLGSQVQVAIAVLSVPVGLLGLTAALGATTLLAHYLTFGAVLIVGGAVLLICAYRPLRLSRWQWAAVLAAAVAGTAASLLISRESEGGLYVFTMHAGYPFDYMAWSADFDRVVPAAEARAFIRDNLGAVRSGFEPMAMLVDAAFWGYVGLLVLVPVRQIIRLARRDRDAAEDTESAAPVEEGEQPAPA